MRIQIQARYIVNETPKTYVCLTSKWLGKFFHIPKSQMEIVSPIEDKPWKLVDRGRWLEVEVSDWWWNKFELKDKLLSGWRFAK